MDISDLYARFREHGQVCTDTRNILPGALFFALKGERFDGHAFARKALADGAALAVVSDRSLTGQAFFQVDDTLVALQALARHHRRELGIPVVAITGSNGKTTTKELVYTALSTTYRTYATPGNLNNHIGVPLTLLGTPPDTELLICEMGANHRGEIAMLAAIAEPTHGLITNIGEAHLEGFGSLDGVKRGKGELFAFLKSSGGTAFINGNDPALRELSTMLTQKTIYGIAPATDSDICFSLEEPLDHAGFVLRDRYGPSLIKARLYGAYNAINMVAAIAVGRHFGVPEEALVHALSEFVSTANRSEVITLHGCTIIKDAYNANPSSMEASVCAFAKSHPDGWIIAGDMKELGDASLEAHSRLLGIMRDLPVRRIVVVGPEFMRAVEALRPSDYRIEAVPDVDSLARHWHWPSDQAILMKGSRSMQLERLLDA